MSAVWNPQEENLAHIISVIKESQSLDIATKRASQEKLDELQKNPDFNHYLLYILTKLPTEGTSTRNLSGLILTKNVTDRFDDFTIDLLEDLKFQCLVLVGDPSPLIRATISTLITTIASKGELYTNFIDLVVRLCHFIDSEDYNVCEGSFSALNEMLERSSGLLDSDALNKPLNILISKCVQFLKKNKPRIRSLAFACVNCFITHRKRILMPHIDDFLENMFYLASNEDPEMWKSVCQALPMLFEVKKNWLIPLMHDSGDLPSIAMFWDVENIYVPADKISTFSQNLRRTFLSTHYEADFIAVLNTTDNCRKHLVPFIDEANIDILHSYEIIKNSADYKLKHRMTKYVDSLKSGTLLIISNDGDFGKHLSDYRKIGMRVILVHSGEPSKRLKSNCDEEHDIKIFIEDHKTRDSSQSTSSGLSSESCLKIGSEESEFENVTEERSVPAAATSKRTEKSKKNKRKKSEEDLQKEIRRPVAASKTKAASVSKPQAKLRGLQSPVRGVRGPSPQVMTPQGRGGAADTAPPQMRPPSVSPSLQVRRMPGPPMPGSRGPHPGMMGSSLGMMGRGMPPGPMGRGMQMRGPPLGRDLQGPVRGVRGPSPQVMTSQGRGGDAVAAPPQMRPPPPGPSLQILRIPGPPMPGSRGPPPRMMGPSPGMIGRGMLPGPMGRDMQMRGPPPGRELILDSSPPRVATKTNAAIRTFKRPRELSPGDLQEASSSSYSVYVGIGSTKSTLSRQSIRGSLSRQSIRGSLSEDFSDCDSESMDDSN